MKEKTVIVIAGGFDPMHLGHLEHIIAAKDMGDELVVITHPDEILIAKKGYCLLPLRDRVEILRSIKYVDRVIVSIDKDGTVAETLRIITPDMFVKGGDRTPDNIPVSEREVCREIGCKVVQDMGLKVGSSSDYFREAMKAVANE